jgi:hypothetical protein
MSMSEKILAVDARVEHKHIRVANVGYFELSGKRAYVEFFHAPTHSERERLEATGHVEFHSSGDAAYIDFDSIIFSHEIEARG